jgi:membrane-associated protease RseP (regulator of RpoE activity)
MRSVPVGTIAAGVLVVVVMGAVVVVTELVVVVLGAVVVTTGAVVVVTAGAEVVVTAGAEVVVVELLLLQDARTMARTTRRLRNRNRMANLCLFK